MQQGHRIVLRRRLALTAAGVAMAAVVGVAGSQLAGPPKAMNPAVQWTSSVPVATGIDLNATNFSDGIKKGPGFDLSIRGPAGGPVNETWHLYDGDRLLRTVNRTVPALEPGQASWLMPKESGQAHTVYGWLNVGPQQGHLSVQVVADPSNRADFNGAMGDVRDHTTGRVIGQAWVSSGIGDEALGVTWNVTSTAGTPWTFLAYGAAERFGRTSGVDAAVVAESSSQAIMLWRTGAVFGLAGMVDLTAPNAPGPLQASVKKSSQASGTHDLAYGWLKGKSAVTVSSTDPTDAFTVSYGPTVKGWRPFVALSTAADVKGSVTVTGAGESTTLTDW